jgi:beta-glucosidase
MKINLFIKALLITALMTATANLGLTNLHGGDDQKLPYQDPVLPIEQRVNDLLSRMTLEEKVGQMNMPCIYIDELGKTIEEKTAACKKFVEGTNVPGLGPGGGLFDLANIILLKGPGQQARFFNELQKIAVENTRLGIPLLQIEEGTHGVMCSGATIFPEGPGLGSTWDMDLIKDIYAATAKEARSVGIHQLYTLSVEPIRDPRLGRNEECYTEDPYLSGRIAEKIVEGAQGKDVAAPDKVVAGLCHFPGQSEPVSGLEKGEMEISERKLREVFLPPWEAGIKKAGALGIMAAYPAIDSEPVHASEHILTDILRGELGFEGLVLSEGEGFNTLLWNGIVATQKEAGVLALKAGVDVGITYEEAFMLPLIESVKEGLVSEELIDRAVTRILKVKFLQGLFENPYVDPNRAEMIVYAKTHQELALKAAHRGIVLLKNEGNLLPLKKDIGTIAVIGPNADNGRNQLGDYTSRVILQDIVTMLDGIREKVSVKTQVDYVKGCDVTLTRSNEIVKACKAAKRADVAIVVVGENERRAANNTGTNGEGKDMANLDLTGLQQEMVEAVSATGTPTIVVLINGRPLSTRWIAEHVPAIVEAWLPGEKGGYAVADILFGDVNPSGKLAITVPRHSGQLPAYYNYKPSKAIRAQGNEHGWVDLPFEPLYEFGFGLSYTSFEYKNLTISPTEKGTGGNVCVSVEVTNTGRRAGSEVVQLYIDDVLSSVTTPVIELRGFEKVTLSPGEKTKVEFTLTPYDLSLLDRNMKRLVEPGEFKIMVGSSSKDIRLEGFFCVTE